LATTEAALVVHLARRNGRQSRACEPIIHAVLSDSDIVLAGCSIDQDLQELRSHWKGLEAHSRLDLGFVNGDKTTITVGLKQLTRIILGLNLVKSKRLATSNWSQVPLTERQIAYSARDAWVGAAIASRLGTLEPEKFGTVALVSRLESQRTIKDLQWRQVNRKKAKDMLSALYSFSKQNQKVLGSTTPEWKTELARNLKSVMKANQFEPNEFFGDVELLDYQIADCNRTV
jgi:hypothetical protein